MKKSPTSAPTPSVTRIDGQPDVRDADGLIVGDVLPDDGSRPRLEPLGDGPIEYAMGISDPFRETITIAHGENASGLSDMTHAAHGIPTDRRASDDEAELLRLAEAEAAGELPASDRRAAAPTEET